jgi:1-acyl-sn-glycerol-3-phosphate acyltransferase
VVARIVGLRVVVDGPVPSAPGLLVANHLSYLDIIVLGSIVPAVFVARGDLAGWPVVGPVARAAGTLFIERSDRWRLPSVLAEVRRVIDTGGRVIVFPEGTSSDGRQVLPFRSSTLEPVAAVGLPVAWAALQYETGPGLPPPEQAVCSWGKMTLAGHLCRLLMLPRVTGHVQFGRYPGGEPDRRELACRLQRAVSDAHASLQIRVGAGARHG